MSVRTDSQIADRLSARRLFEGVELNMRSSLPIEECRRRLQLNVVRRHWWGGPSPHDAFRSWRNHGTCIGTVDGDRFQLQWHTFGKKENDSPLIAHGNLRRTGACTDVHVSLSLNEWPILGVALWLGLVGLINVVIVTVTIIEFAANGTSPTWPTLFLPAGLLLFGVVVGIILAGTAQSDAVRLHAFLMTALDAEDLDVRPTSNQHTNPSTQPPSFDALLRDYFDEREQQDVPPEHPSRNWPIVLMIVVPPALVLVALAALGFMSWT